MSQYYHVLLEEAASKKRKFDRGPETGRTLVKHAWFGNPYTNYYCKLLELIPCRIAWTGDYAGDSCFDRYGIPHDNRNEFNTEIKKPTNTDWNYEKKYLTNHTKKEFIDLTKYKKENYNKIYDSALNPLALLTAFTNGLSNGDYTGPSDLKKVGTWAWDILEMKYSKPQYYKEVMPRFIIE